MYEWQPNELEEFQRNLELFKRDFKSFAQYCWRMEMGHRQMKWNWHHDCICDHLQAIGDGETRHTYFILPPRHGKSTLISYYFHPWIWLRNPGAEFISVSHNATKAEDNAGLSKEIIMGSDPKNPNWYQKLILAMDPSDRWTITKSGNERIRNSKKGMRRAIGMGGGLQGDNADYTLLDDILDAADVTSAARLLTLREFWRDKISTRFNDHKTGVHIAINHRLTEMDLIGLIHETEDMEMWNRVVLPCLYDVTFPKAYSFKTKVANKSSDFLPKGEIWTDLRKYDREMLHPERFGPEEMKIERKKMSNKAWNAQYQGRPSGKDGDVFQRRWFTQNRIDENDNNLLVDEFIIQSWDTAYTEEKLKLKDQGEQNSYSVCTTWSISHPKGHKKEKYYVLRDMWMGMRSYPELREKVIDLDDQWMPDAIIMEKASSGISILQEFENTGIPLYPFIPKRSGKKRLRAEAASLMVEKGAVLIPQGKTGDLFIDFCCQYPTTGKDVVDTFSQMILWGRENADILVAGDEKEVAHECYDEMFTSTSDYMFTGKKTSGPGITDEMTRVLVGDFD